MKHRFFKKLFLTTTIIILVSLAAITIILSFFVSSYITNDKINLLEKTCDTVDKFTGALDISDVNNLKSLNISFVAVYICAEKYKVS